MPIYTNENNLPETIADALRAYDLGYSGGGALDPRHISVTTLIDAPYRRALKRAHAHEVTEDVVDNVWRLLGSAVHEVLAKGAHDLRGDVAETRLEARYQVGELWTVSGQPDLVTGAGVVVDYKTTSVWSVVHGKPAWVQQLNVYAAILRAHGLPVTGCQVVAILRDWQKSKARYQPADGNYPRAPLVVVDLPLWTEAEADAFIRARLLLHEMALSAPLDAVTPCDPAERWADPPTFAVVPKGKKRALRVFAREVDAYEFAAAKGAEVVSRPGGDKRCADYCEVAPWCPWWQAKISEEKS